jgi:UDP-N-acetylglucosamine--N-acetylmuramyl-(pentapeptide) pyrophosphoryl-undecaprenol N-acetylglucosamine transferase
VARCGASTILEIAKFHLPAVLIPYPFAGGHQKENAKLLSESPIAKIIEEKDLTPQLLVEGVKDLWAHRLNRQETAQRVRNIFIPEAEVRLAREIVSLK